MAKLIWGDTTWRRLDAVDGQRAVAILPVGAVEAHGPHLPTGTDVLIAEAMADNAAERLAAAGIDVAVLPPLAYTAAPFAQGFRGTVSVSPQTVSALIVDIGRSLKAQGFAVLSLANAHFDPANLDSLRQAVERLEADTDLRVAFPDVTRRPWVSRLTEEFRSGACHAGRYEGSVVMAVRPDLVDETVRRELPAHRVSLSRAIAQGKRSFEEAGGRAAYFGDPAAATASEGERTIETLGGILQEAVLAALRQVGD